MAGLTLIKRGGPLADIAELVLFGVALTYGGELWLHSLHFFSGVPQDWWHMLSEATVKLPLVLLAIWGVKIGLQALLSRRGANLPRLASKAIIATGMSLAAFTALIIDGLSTQFFYPELALTGTNPFLCTVLSVGVEAAAAIPALGTAYDAVVTLPALLVIAALLVSLRPLGAAPQRATA